jgi:hypothetical protein
MNSGNMSRATVPIVALSLWGCEAPVDPPSDDEDESTAEATGEGSETLTASAVGALDSIDVGTIEIREPAWLHPRPEEIRVPKAYPGRRRLPDNDCGTLPRPLWPRGSW